MSGERYEIRFQAAARRAIAERLPESVAAAVLEFCEAALAVSPRRVGKPLFGPLAGCHGARRGTYRIVYRIDEQAHAVQVLDIDHRAGIYHRPSARGLQDPHKIPTTGPRQVRTPRQAGEGRTPGARPVRASGTGRAATRGGGEVIELEYGITVYREEHGRWRAVWYETGDRQQCEAASEEKLAARLEKVKERLEADAPNMKRPGADLIAHYLDSDRLPVDERWFRKHAHTLRRLCERFAAPVVDAVTCQDIKTEHTQKIVNAAPTPGEGALAAGRHGERDELMANTAAYSGLRWGELTALTVPQVDQAARAITVDRKVVEVAGHLYIEAPNNRKFRGTIYPRRTPAGYPRYAAARDQQAGHGAGPAADLPHLGCPHGRGEVLPRDPGRSQKARHAAARWGAGNRSRRVQLEPLIAWLPAAGCRAGSLTPSAPAACDAGAEAMSRRVGKTASETGIGSSKASTR